MVPAEGLKAKIRNGEITIGVGMPMTVSADDFESALAYGKGEYEFVFVDGQHSPFSERALVDFCQLASRFELPVRLRILHTRQAYLLGTYLDLGASGIEVPQVEEEGTADEATESFYYPPLGRRSVGGGGRRSQEDFPDTRDYADWWNRNGVLWLQIESLSAVVNAHKLAKPGVDCLSFGPADLTLDIEAHPNPPYGSVEECVSAVAATVKGTQTALCFRNGTPDLRQKYADLGATVFLERPPV